jgi:peptide/nickel transport system permease protein
VARFAIRRLGAALLTVLLVVSITFVLAHLAPGEPMLGEPERGRADPARAERMRAEFGLDQPMPVQYARYVANAMRGNLGESFMTRRPVGALVRERLPRTALLAFASLILAFAGGIGIAMLQARRPGSWRDALLGGTTLVFHSMPSFWLGLVLLVIAAQWLGWLPVSGMTTAIEHDTMGFGARVMDVGRHLVLPALTLALVQTAEIARFQRGALVDALGSDFVRAARARGAGERVVMLRHALRSALAPVIVLAGMSVPALLAGSVLVESVFGWPGMGRLTQEAILARDYNVILAVAIVSGVLVALGNLAADLAVRALDPRATA